MMEALDRCYPGFDLAAHKGYGTPAHLEALRDPRALAAAPPLLQSRARGAGARCPSLQSELPLTGTDPES